MTDVVLLRGGGDLASGVAYRLHRVGIPVMITELPQPLAVRRTVSFAEAVYQGKMTVEGTTACLAKDATDAIEILHSGHIPVLIDPLSNILHSPLFTINVLIDARLTKQTPDLGIVAAPLVIGLGPGFLPGKNCHAAIESHRGHTLGRVHWDTPPRLDTGLPEGNPARVLRAPLDGKLTAFVEIGDQVGLGQLLADIDGEPVTAPLGGVVRGLMHSDLHVKLGMKIGDVDSRNDPSYCYQLSDKALAIGGGVLEAILTKAEIRAKLWGMV